VLGQLPEVKLLFERLAKESAVAVNEDQLECLLAVSGPLDHLLEHGPAIVPRGRATFDELRSHDAALGAAPSLQLAALVGNGQIVFSLAPGRDPHVKGGASALIE
jgi:hypothetical protein